MSSMRPEAREIVFACGFSTIPLHPRWMEEEEKEEGFDGKEIKNGVSGEYTGIKKIKRERVKTWDG